jgi:putative FmdB family regulatory protein
MPIYEYKCKDCGQEFETLVLGSEKPVCEKCNSQNLEKKFSSFAVGNTTSSDMSDCSTGACNLTNQCPSGVCGLN